LAQDGARGANTLQWGVAVCDNKREYNGAMKVLFFVRGADEVSVRFRVHQYLPHLGRRGVAAKVIELRTTSAERWRSVRSARAFDAVVVHRAFLNPIELALLRRCARRWLYDFDDAILFRDSAGRRFGSWQRRLRFARMVRHADAVTAGSRYLADWAARYNRRVTVLPTGVDPAEYRPTAVIPASRPVIGWIGTRINLMYLHAVVPALQRVARQRPDVTLKVVSDGTFEVPGVTVVNQPWTRAGEAEELAGFTAGIMPLPDDPWTRGKCGVKILQYLAAGVPVVCSPVGANRDIVAHGHNGYFATSEEQWVARLDELLVDAGLRARFAQAGRETIAARYSVATLADRLVAVLGGSASS
jgi:glycosyltransferase involved in cell wall biosynthesis